MLTLSLIPNGNDDDLQGVMCESPRTCQQVLYSYLSKSVGVENLTAALSDGTTGQQIVFAYSEGARAAERWLDENAGQEGVPSPEELSFVLMGNPTRKYGGADRDFDTFPRRTTRFSMCRGSTTQLRTSPTTRSTCSRC